MMMIRNPILSILLTVPLTYLRDSLSDGWQSTPLTARQQNVAYAALKPSLESSTSPLIKKQNHQRKTYYI